MADIRQDRGQADRLSSWRQSAVAAALLEQRPYLLAATAFSGAANVLMLSGSLFMLQVYDRVLHSRSIPTLITLLLMVMAAFAAYAALDAVRSRMFTRMSEMLDAGIGHRLFALLLPQAGGAPGAQSRSSQALRDLDHLRSFLSGPAPGAFFDLPWMPVYLVVVFLLHPLLGWFTIGGMIALIALALFSEYASRKPIADAARLAAQQAVMTESIRRSGEALVVMGMSGRLMRVWNDKHVRAMMMLRQATDVTTLLASIGKGFRLFFQSLILALGAYLVIVGDLTGGAIAAASILGARALQPIEQVVSQWRAVAQMRSCAERIDAVLEAAEQGHRPLTRLPAPQQTVALNQVAVVAPGQRRAMLPPLSVSFAAGDGIGIMGPSGCGKTSVLRTLVGLWQPPVGDIRFDGADIRQWDRDELGAHIGYLPQAVDLFDGTVAQNIARFTNSSAETVVKAAMAAGAHDMIVRLPQGYDTFLTDNGASLSAGQKQRIGLARALFGDPFLVVLDEPNANLDAAGENALHEAITQVRERGGIVVLATHRPSALTAVDKLLVFGHGSIGAFGMKDEVLSKMVANRGAIEAASRKP
jgi:ATP-binding cassette, subfamily C, bacterial PrsD